TFTWAGEQESPRLSKAERSFYAHAADFGIRSGITIPVKTAVVRLSWLISFNCGDAGDAHGAHYRGFAPSSRKLKRRGLSPRFEARRTHIPICIPSKALVASLSTSLAVTFPEGRK
ncbi:MAG: hypothetical protein E5V63_30610, partial [Mesorhizobium sp.]